MTKPSLSKEAQTELTRWPTRAKRLLGELLDDAASALQQELLQRAVAAGHSPNEVHAFADQLRGMADDEAFAACTLDQDAPRDYTVTQLLRAEADPLFAFELKGGTLEPDDNEAPLVAVKPKADVAVLRRITASFVADSSDASPAMLSVSQAALTPVGGSSSGLGSLLQEATRAHGLSWHETDVDAEPGMTLDAAVEAAGDLLEEGLPVPLGLGDTAGNTGRLVIALQVMRSGHTRAWQLFDPFSNELVWVNERDLLTRQELPFANKFYRRMTCIALPARRRTA